MTNWLFSKIYEDTQCHIRIKSSFLDNKKILVVEFQVFEANTYNEEILYEKSLGNSYVPTTNVEEANTFITGSVKWDGCSHLNFGEGGYIHGCNADTDGARIGNILQEVYRRAHDLLTDTDWEMSK